MLWLGEGTVITLAMFVVQSVYISSLYCSLESVEYYNKTRRQVISELTKQRRAALAYPLLL